MAPHDWLQQAAEKLVIDAKPEFFSNLPQKIKGRNGRKSELPRLRGHL